MELPVDIRCAVEEIASQYTLKQLSASEAALSEKYRGERVPGKKLIASRQEAVTYAVCRMPATYGAVTRALEMTALPEIPETLLDVGAGTGASTLAAAERFPLRAVFCMEQEREMRELGQKLLAASELPALTRAKFRPGDIVKGTDGCHAELVLVSYVLNELPEKDLPKAVENLWEAAEQTLVLVEPGTPEGYRLLQRVKKILLPRGAYLAAPCPAECRCPLTAEDWCHFTCRVARSRLHKQLKGGDVPYEDEKFTFLVFTRKEPTRAENRVLRHPKIAPGNIALTLCEGSCVRDLTVTKKDGAIFKRARKADAGDCLPLGETE